MSYAQQSGLYTWFDDQVGYENLEIYNGIQFINTYKPINNKHRFFETDSFVKGKISYNNQSYEVNLRYDLYEDQLIILADTRTNSNEILLIKELVEHFEISSSHFIHLKGENKGINSGFYEVIYNNGSITLLKKHSKQLKQDIENRKVYYEFKAEKAEYFCVTEDEMFQIKNKKDIISRFPKFKRELSRFKIKARRLEANETQLKYAIESLGKLITN